MRKGNLRGDGENDSDEGTISKEDGEGGSFLIVKAQRRRLCGEDVAKTESAWEGGGRRLVPFLVICPFAYLVSNCWYHRRGGGD